MSAGQRVPQPEVAVLEAEAYREDTKLHTQLLMPDKRHSCLC